MKKLLSKTYWEDQDVEQLVGLQLRFGVIISSIVVLAGGTFYLLAQGQMAVPDYTRFIGEGQGYTSFTGIIRGVAHLQTKEFIQLGVLLLIATPILRIAFSLFAFVLEKDKLYIGITILVLCIIFFSMFGGLKV
ncbi:Uncharacterized membrane protein [Mucilaginibacter gossypiicola]|uniref:Uncharacterized membrane protein n=1 Tax=Mucilaginibacter gossypiicola TaxID=551995 RepID=A0A1H8UAK7_9SPHI|nr:DUF1634 domain-containing protein [Mucilaginibacter gossypiicola]SEP00302.1 Uncharacterized membrane protein [Mucilaginibacter gossypiicola]